MAANTSARAPAAPPARAPSAANAATRPWASRAREQRDAQAEHGGLARGALQARRGVERGERLGEPSGAAQGRDLRERERLRALAAPPRHRLEARDDALDDVEALLLGGELDELGRDEDVSGREAGRALERLERAARIAEALEQPRPLAQERRDPGRVERALVAELLEGPRRDGGLLRRARQRVELGEQRPERRLGRALVERVAHDAEGARGAARDARVAQHARERRRERDAAAWGPRAAREPR